MDCENWWGKNWKCTLLFGKQREVDYKYDGFSTNLIPFGVITVKHNDSTNIKEGRYVLYVGTEKFEGLFEKNPYDSSFVSDIGKVVDKNNNYANVMFAIAYPELQELYKQGEPYATFILGAYHNYGIGGVLKSFEEALKYIKAAAEFGHSGALFDLGKFYEIGKGVEKDLNKAYEYYSRAAKIGNVRAKNKIDEMQEEVKDQ